MFHVHVTSFIIHDSKSFFLIIINSKILNAKEKHDKTIQFPNKESITSIRYMVLKTRLISKSAKPRKDDHNIKVNDDFRFHKSSYFVHLHEIYQTKIEGFTSVARQNWGHLLSPHLPLQGIYPPQQVYLHRK